MSNSELINQPRGEAVLCVDGKNHKLCLTLGALAELESTLGGGNLEKLQQRLKQPKVSDMLLILHALLRGGGSALTLEALKASDVDLGKAAKAIGDAFNVIGVGDDESN